MAEITQQQNNSQQNTCLFIESTLLTGDFINILLTKTYEGVGLQNAKKMAPKNTHRQAMHALASFVKVGFTQKYQKDKKVLRDERDPQPAEIDNLAVQQIETQKSKLKSLTPIMQQALSTSSKSKAKREKTEKLNTQRKTSRIDQNQDQTKSKVISNFQKIPQTLNQFDFSEDPQLNKIRSNFLKFEQQNQLQESQLRKVQQKNAVQKLKGQKIIKDMKKITYDYEGKLFGQGNGITKPQKMMFLNNKFSDIKKINKKLNSVLQKTTIQTGKKKDQKSDRKQTKQVPMFREQAHSIIQTIQSSKGISAGVKIKEQLGDNKSVTKQNPLKKPKIHSLVQFKNNSKQSRFRQYHPTSLNKDKSQLNYTSNNEETNRSKNNQNSILNSKRMSSFNRDAKSLSSYSLMDGQNKYKTLDLLEEYQSSRGDEQSRITGNQENRMNRKKAEYKGLPFIKTKGYKAIDFASQKSFKMIFDQKNQNYKQKLRSRIYINDMNLLKVTLEDL